MALTLNSELLKFKKSFKGSGIARELNPAKLFNEKIVRNQNISLSTRIKEYLKFKKEYGSTIQNLIKQTQSKSFFNVMKILHTDSDIKVKYGHIAGGICNCNGLSKRSCTTRYFLKEFYNYE